MKTRRIIIAVVVATGLLLSGCTSQEAKQAGKNAEKEQKTVSDGFRKLSESQQIPAYDWSQERQTLIDIETIRATGASTTTAGYLEGVGMVWWCPSIGAPVPSTYQLSATDQYVNLSDDGTNERFPVDQGEPTGVYVGDSTGTWTICLDDNGKKFAKYWEGYTDSTTGSVTTYEPKLRVRPSDVTFKFTDDPTK